MADVFISYKREDRARVAQLARTIERQGYSVWWDSDLISGERWSKRIKTELDAASCVVVVWSKNSVASDHTYTSEWVENEAEIAAKRGILVPVLIDPDRVAWTHSRLQLSDLSDWSGESDHPNLANLVAGIKRNAGAREARERVAAPTGGSLTSRAESPVLDRFASPPDLHSSSNSSSTQAASEPVSLFRAPAGSLAIGCLLVGMIVALTRDAHPFLNQPLSLEFGVAFEQLSLLNGVAVGLFSLIGIIIGASVSNDVKRPARTVFLVTLWPPILMLAGAVIASSFDQLFVMRAFGAISLGAMIVTFHSYIGRSTTHYGWSFGFLGLAQGATLFAIAVSSTSMIESAGWRTWVFGLAILAILAAIVSSLLLRGRRIERVLSHRTLSIGQLTLRVGAPAAITSLAISLAMGYVFFHVISLAEATDPSLNIVVALVIFVGVFLGGLAAGALGDWVFKRSRQGYYLVGLIAALFGGVSAWSLGVASSLNIALIALLLHAMAGTISIASFYAVAQHSSAEKSRTWSAAIPLSASILAIFAIGPMVLGFLPHISGMEAAAGEFRPAFFASSLVWGVASIVLFVVYLQAKREMTEDQTR